jgi:hypothetical protein
MALVREAAGSTPAHSARLPKLQTFNDAADAWDQGLRAKFKATSFALHFVHCATCDPELTVDFHADQTGESHPPALAPHDPVGLRRHRVAG